MTVPAFLHSYARPAAGPEAFITIVAGQGAEVVDEAGNRYVDALASLWYCAVGHGRDEIVDAVMAQMRRLAAFHTFDRFTNAPAEAVSETLRRIAPMPDARVFFTCGGSEAVDSALKLARLAHHVAGQPERTLVVSRRPSYHGVTYGAMTATGLPANQEGFGPLVGEMVQVPYDDLDALDAVLDEHGDRLAAIIAEPVVGAGGVYAPPEGYLAGLRQRCDRHGGFLVADEVICGFGRLGHWWGVQRHGVVPDLVTFAKGVTSGYQPLGGVLVGPEVRRRLEGDAALVLRHGHTYSAHPSACAAAVANLAILERERLAERAEPVGRRLASGLGALVDGETALGVRGQGGVWAIALAPGVGAADVREELLVRGVIARPIGADTVAFCPPLVISDAQIDHCVEATGEAVLAVAKAR
ncbi:MAG TPA: aminotransferase class III-fold pyridoxal phosphate-dependent enzyme [Acidimicrobiales bacterium]|nr:aminotransferase class III-fold pyridoxal phosphate-dependent enzyme [Acidimicrobiales bacterium]